MFSNRELERAGFDFVREAEQNIYYEGINVGTRRADFVVENKVIVELKALTNLEDVHLAQAKNYVVAYKFEKGLLINFGATSLQYKLILSSNQNSVNSYSDSYSAGFAPSDRPCPQHPVVTFF